MVALADVEEVQVDAEPCGMLLMSAEFDDYATIHGIRHMVKVFYFGEGDMMVFSGSGHPDCEMLNVTKAIGEEKAAEFMEKGKDICREKLAWLKQRFETV